MNRTWKQILSATAALMLVATTTGPAFADRDRGRDHGRSHGDRFKSDYGRSGGYGKSHNYRGSYKSDRGPRYGYDHKYKHNYKHNYKNNYKYGHRHGNWYAPRHSYYYNYGYGYYPRHYYGYDSGGTFVLGAATGLMLGAVIASSQDRGRDTVYVPSDTYYASSSGRAPEYAQQTAFAEECLQIREYTTTIIIAGREEEGYGDACLQSDGSWVHGPVKVAPRD